MDPSCREQLHAAIQATTQTDPELNGAILLGWVTVVEWMHPTGNRWLSRLSANTTADREAPDWTLQGWLHNALNDWPTPNEDDD